MRTTLLNKLFCDGEVLVTVPTTREKFRRLCVQATPKLEKRALVEIKILLQKLRKLVILNIIALTRSVLTTN